MANQFLHNLLTPEVLAAQTHYYGRAYIVPSTHTRDALTPTESGFIGRRDSFYMATVSSNHWPYIQHRGGPNGFLKVLDAQTLAFADFKGNRQLISTGNLSANDRVALFLMDYPNRKRLKILGHARVLDARKNSELARQLTLPSLQQKIERLCIIDVVSYDWNCPQFITPRYTPDEMKELQVSPL